MTLATNNVLVPATAPADFAAAAREAAQITHMLAATRLAELAASPNCEPEVAIKIYNATKDVGGAVPDKKADPFANLPVFHIHFNNGRLEATGVTPALQVLDVSEAFDFNLETAVPTAAMVAAADINDELLVALENL